MAIPKRVEERLTAALKRFTPILLQQKARDISEADTVTLVKDLLSEAFGYDKYTEITGEYAIRGTYCDLAIKADGKLTQLVEVKAIGTTLTDHHIKQAIDYGANQGVEWVILTNAITWRLYQIIFAKPIDKRLLVEIDLTTLNPKEESHLDLLYLFTKEGYEKGAHIELRDRQDATSRYMLAALLTNNDSILATIRRELRRVVDVLIDDQVILKVLQTEVIKRDTLEGPPADLALKRVTRREDRALRTNKPRPEPELPAAIPSPLVPSSPESAGPPGASAGNSPLPR